MPDWQPNWADVTFDHGAATRAVTVCRSTAATLHDVRSIVAGGRPAAVEDWTGPHADDFLLEEPVVLEELRSTRTDLLALATAIEEGSAAASAEQVRREAERDRWRRELAAERAAADDPHPVPPGGGGPGPTFY